MTLHVLSAGSGYEYLTRQVASGDHTRNGQDLSAYYAESGYPPGRCRLGRGGDVRGDDGEDQGEHDDQPGLRR